MDQIYYGGVILTMKGEEPEYVQAVKVSNGKILQVGTIEELTGKEEVEWIDLRGKTMLPAFIDAHSHITAFANTLGIVNLSDCTSFEEIIEKMKKYKEENQIQKGEWIIGFSYDHNFLKEKRHPTKEVLDQVAKDNPIMISHTSGHMGIVNSIALKEMNLTKETQAPKGGKFGMDEKKKELTGYLEENAFFEYSKKAGKFTLEKLVKLMEKAQYVYVSKGITTIQDGLTKKPEWVLLKYMADHQKLIADVVSYIDIKENQEIITENPQYVKQYKDHLKIGGYKLILDGSPQGKTAWITAPYEGEREYRGYPACSDQQVEEYLTKAIQENIQMLVHCNGDAAIDQLINAYEKRKKEEKEPIRPVIIHAQTIREDQIKKAKKLGMLPSYFNTHVYYWGDIHKQNLGKRALKISPAGTSRKEKLIYTFHQDTPVIRPNPLENVWSAVCRKTKEGQVLGEEEKVSVYEALKAVTINVAYQYFEEKEKGTIEIGKIADFAILENNPLEVQIDKIKDIRIIKTIKQGKVVYDVEKNFSL